MKYKKRCLFLIGFFWLSSFYIHNSIVQAGEFDSINTNSNESITMVNSPTIEDDQPSPCGQVQMETIQEDFQCGYFNGIAENINLSSNGAQLGIDAEEGNLESNSIPALIPFFA
ncbi:hypothetical protein B188_24150 [Candidatus Brocadiaceae bacterium B188]|nr:hypothetical protein [Candidatus Brocadia sapporoensis]QQR65675.1 MAG: hypothetical protein IPI25_08830 [Candidatus Brocadia sp.]RZV59824.1 MAG: hypothetical protein EX330_01220 [Candidatus Brocadia sp. BROELEC01]TWU49987.1 hypothetical protein B188_24150 [Candidatus Brocadiaceae bacterium B188]